ncbi:MAG: hypothetical protein ACRYFU_18755 [Janthinobacterium lividum]
MIHRFGAAFVLCCACFPSWTAAAAQTGLKVEFGPEGLEKLSYNGVVLEDAKAVPADAFHIWHMKATDAHGQVLTGGQYGWGESNNGRHWDARTQTWIYTFSWGSISAQYVQSGDTLDVLVTTTNAANSGIVFDGASIFPLALHFPALPKGFSNPVYPQLAYNTTGPSVTVADFGSGEVIAVVPDASRPVYSGFFPADNNTAYATLLSGTVPDGLATFQPHNDRPVPPGKTDHVRLSLRFQPSGTATYPIAGDAYSNWAKAYPSTLHWTDHRAIGTVFLGSSPQGNDAQPGGFPNNPRRYFTDANPGDFDVTNPVGLVAFQRRVIKQAETNVENLKVLGAQGAITWDIEGEQYPQETSYVCSPDQVGTIAPEMESVLSGGSPYAGMKLDDAYFKIMRTAGFRVGVCIRPQHFTLRPDGTAHQEFLPTSKVGEELTRKIRYAHDRWGATIFYIDSTVDGDRGTLPASIFKQVAAEFPDSLLIPEESTPLYNAYTAPFKSFIYLNATGTEPDVYHIYPDAFSAVLINNVAPAKLAGAETALIRQVAHGDIMMGQVDYREANNEAIAALYRNAKRSEMHSPAARSALVPDSLQNAVSLPEIPSLPLMYPLPLASLTNGGVGSRQ